MSVVLQVVVATFLTVPLNLLTLWDGIATAQLEARIKAMRQAGEPTSLAELAKLYPDPPPGQNAAQLFDAAFQLMEARRDDRRGDDLPIVGDGQLPLPGEPLPPAMLEGIEAYLAGRRDILELLHDGAALDHCKFDLRFEDGIAMELSHLSWMRQGARLLALEAVARAEREKADEAAESLWACLRLGGALRQEPVLISGLVRMATDGIAAGHVERLVARARPSPKALLRVEQALAAEADASFLQMVFIAERCFGMDIYRKHVLAEGKDPFAELLGGGPGNLAPLLKVVPKAYFKADLIHYIDLMNEHVAAAKRPYPESLLEGARIGRELEQRIPRYYVVCRMILPALGHVFKHSQRHMARLDSTRIGLAALRYQAATQRPPDTLQALVPDFVKAVPPDPFTGQPLRYRREDEGFVVYAVGENGKDDGGRTEGEDRNTPDIGFRVRRPKAEF